MHASRRQRRSRPFSPPMTGLHQAAPAYKVAKLVRGQQGFGFTISGQAPCILSCVVPNSSADRAGLQAGDCLLAVNGCDVSRAPHDEVVRLVGSCMGTLKLHLAEASIPAAANGYSSSDEGSDTRHRMPSKTRPPRTRHATRWARQKDHPSSSQPINSFYVRYIVSNGLQVEEKGRDAAEQGGTRGPRSAERTITRPSSSRVRNEEPSPTQLERQQPGAHRQPDGVAQSPRPDQQSKSLQSTVLACGPANGRDEKTLPFHHFAFRCGPIIVHPSFGFGFVRALELFSLLGEPSTLTNAAFSLDV